MYVSSMGKPFAYIKEFSFLAQFNLFGLQNISEALNNSRSKGDLGKWEVPLLQRNTPAV